VTASKNETSVEPHAASPSLPPSSLASALRTGERAIRLGVLCR
jgi:hypothetical protein